MSPLYESHRHPLLPRPQFLVRLALHFLIAMVLVLGSLLLVIVSFVLLAQFSGASPHSTYIPAHIDENGKFVPGAEK